MSEDRLVELESKIGHQDFLIEGLSRQVQDQSMLIFQMEAKLVLLEKKVHELLHELEATGPSNQKPPHY